MVGSSPVTKLFKKFDIPEDEESEATTISGWAIEKLGQIPQSGDAFEYEGVRVEILDTDLKKIDTLLVTIVRSEEEE